MSTRRRTWGHVARMTWLAAWVVLAAGPTLATPVAPAADAARGEKLYVRCLACHALVTDRVGPRHCGLLGRRAGSVAGFAYSPAMQHSGLVWNEKTLDRFLAKPLRMVPGSSMTYDGVPDAAERADLIAYLKQANGSATCRPPPEKSGKQDAQGIGQGIRKHAPV